MFLFPLFGCCIDHLFCFALGSFSFIGLYAYVDNLVVCGCACLASVVCL